MRIANPFVMITHVIGSLPEADIGQQSADTIKLDFSFRCLGADLDALGAVHEVKGGNQITKVLPSTPRKETNRRQ
jgi:hypothetical protein